MTRALETIADPSLLPGDPAAYRRRGPGRAFWVAIGFGLFGVAVTLFAWQILPSYFSTGAPTQNGVRVAFPFARPAAQAPEPATTAVEVAPAPAPDAVAAVPPSIATLSARLERLELNQRRTTQAAAAALAAASLAEAAQGSGPFADELTALGGLLPASDDVRALQAVAVSGAPTRASLATEFPDAAARAAAAARAPTSGDGFFARTSRTVARIFTVRRVNQLSGDGADAILARAGILIEEGDLQGAFIELDRLPAGARAALAPWRTKAQGRLEIDRHVSAIRAAALRDLSVTAGLSL